MSAEKPIGLAVAEKFFGLLVILMGALAINFTLNDPPEGIVAPFSPIFIAAGLALVAIGVFLVLARAE